MLEKKKVSAPRSEFAMHGNKGFAHMPLELFSGDRGSKGGFVFSCLVHVSTPFPISW